MWTFGPRTMSPISCQPSMRTIVYKRKLTGTLEVPPHDDRTGKSTPPPHWP